MVLMMVLVIVGVVVALVLRAGSGTSRRAAVSDARAEAQRWIDRLAGSVLTLDPADDAAARQALADAAERLTAATAEQAAATSPAQFRMATTTAMEGLHYVRAARVARGIDPGPDLPETPAAPAATPDAQPSPAKTAMIAGAAGLGGALLFDTLFDHHGGPGMGGFGGPGIGGPGMGGPGGW
jgi:hypothetical protein